MPTDVAHYPLAASVPLVFGACTTLSIVVFCVLQIVLHLKSSSELTMLHRVHNCLRVLIIAQTVFTVAAVVVLSTATAATGHGSATFAGLIAERQAANILKASGATLVAGYSFFATEHQAFRWIGLLGAATMSGMDAADMASVGQLIGLVHASKGGIGDEDDSARRLALWAFKFQYAAKVFSFFSWFLLMQVIGCLMHALGWFHLNELPNDEEVAGHLKELARATINRRVQEKRNPERFEAGGGRHLFNPADKLEVTWDQMVDLAVGRDNRTSHPISANRRGEISPEVLNELQQVLLKMGVKRSQIYEVLDNEDDS